MSTKIEHINIFTFSGLGSVRIEHGMARALMFNSRKHFVDCHRCVCVCVCARVVCTIRRRKRDSSRKPDYPTTGFIFDFSFRILPSCIVQASCVSINQPVPWKHWLFHIVNKLSSRTTICFQTALLSKRPQKAPFIERKHSHI